MSRLAVCLILLSGTLHAGDIEPLVLTGGVTNDGSSQNETGSASESELLQTVFQDEEPAPVVVTETAGTICYEDYCRRCECRTWTARAGVIHWRPDTDGNGSLGTELDANFGPYVNLTRHGDWGDLEFIFFYVDDMDASLTFGPLFTADLEAELQNYEINVKREVIPDVRLLTGVRVVDLDYTADVTGPQVLQNIFAYNRLTGWQWGVEADLYDNGPFSIDTIWKGGVYHNDAKSGFSIPNSGTLLSDGAETAFLTDFWFNMNYQLTDNTAVRGGYSLMYINPTADLNSVGGGFFGGSFITQDVLLHGFHLMLEFSY